MVKERPKRQATTSPKKLKQLKLTEFKKKPPKKKTIEDFSDSESNSKDNSSDEEFKLDSEKEEEEENDDDEISDEEASVQSKSSKEEINQKAPKNKTYNTRRTRSKTPKNNTEEKAPEVTENNVENEEPEILVENFNLEEKISEWKYELDLETKAFKRPKIPSLSDEAIKPFISSKSKPPKFVVYDCPFCQRVFTYPLVFKTHLYSCEKNSNVPEYILYCAKFDKCSFKSKKKQEMLTHFAKHHSKMASFINENRTSIDPDQNDSDSNDSATEIKITNSKKNQLKLTSYLYLDKSLFRFTFQYFNKCLMSLYKNLGYIDQFYSKFKEAEKIQIDLNSIRIESDINFELNKTKFSLKPFGIYSNENDHFKMFYINDQITSIDWCPMKLNCAQYLAIATMPNEKLTEQFKSTDSKLSNNILELNKSPNFIYILKLENLNNKSQFSWKMYTILNKTLGLVSCLKWRPDFGASQSNDFIGYLLAASSDGNSYIYKIKEKSEELNESLSVYDEKQKIILKPVFSFGQCTSADWSALNGATQIAVGYANGSIAIYNLSSNYLQNQFKSNPDQELIVYPFKTLNAHFTFVKTLKWSKLNSSQLCSGSLFSREIKLWDLDNEDRALFDYEVYVADLEFSLHSNDLFISKEMNLKGENHLFALDLGFNLFNREKDESRAHSTLFYTNSTMTSVDQSDYLNKFLVCDNDGSIVLSRSDGCKNWTQKNKFMSFSFAVSCFYLFSNNWRKIVLKYFF